MQSNIRYNAIHLSICLSFLLSFLFLTSAVAQTTWIGSPDNSWHNVYNWTAGVPTPNTDVIIPSGSASNVQISDFDAAAKSITIGSGRTLILSGRILTIDGSSDNALTVQGTFENVGGTLKIGHANGPGLNGIRVESGAQVINGGSFTTLIPGIIDIRNTTGVGIELLGTFTNKFVPGFTGAIPSVVNIGINSTIGDYGVYVSSGTSFTNDGSVLRIESATINGIAVAGTLTNKNQGRIYVENSNIAALDSSVILNQSGSAVNVKNGEIEKIASGDFHNEALITKVSSGHSTISLNSGIILNGGSGTFAIFLGAPVRDVVGADNFWYGYQSDAWTDDLNWSHDIPQSDQGVEIPGDMPHNPVLSSSTELIKGLWIGATSTITILLNGSLSIETNYNYGIRNLGTLINYGEITIDGSNQSATGLMNNGLVVNDGGSIHIDNTYSDGIWQTGSLTNMNNGLIAIGSSLEIGRIGIGLSSGTLLNDSSVITVDRTGVIHPGNWDIMLQSGATLTNRNGGKIQCGLVQPGTSGISMAIAWLSQCINEECSTLDFADRAEIFNVGQLENHGLLSIKSNDSSSISLNTGIIQCPNGIVSVQTNQGVITEHPGKVWSGCVDTLWSNPGNWYQGIPATGSEAVIPSGHSVSIVSAAAASALVLDSSAVLQIHPTGSLDLAGSAQNALQNFGLLSNNGSISIDNVGQDALVNFGTFENLGALAIGSNAHIDNTGILNSHTFTNHNGGNIKIDRTGGSGIISQVATTFTNHGVITIGETTEINSAGIACFGNLINSNSGIIDIVDVSIQGLYLKSGQMDNSGAISIHDCFHAVYNEATLNNTGEISTDGAVAHVVWNRYGGQLNNSGKITISSPGPGNAVRTDNSAFHNIGCQSTLLISTNNRIETYNGGTFTNEGTVSEYSNLSCNISSNSGIVQNGNGGDFMIDTNTGISTTREGFLWTGCIDSLWQNPENWSLGRLPAANTDEIVVLNVLNHPVLATTGFGRSIFLDTSASCTINPGAVLSLDSSSNSAVINNGLFTVNGALSIGRSVGIGQHGVENSGSFFVNDSTSSNLEINHTEGSAIYNTGILELNGLTEIGNHGAIDGHGIHNLGTFKNASGSTLHIDRTQAPDYALFNEASFDNHGHLHVSAQIGNGRGIWNSGTLANHSSASIKIDSTNQSSFVTVNTLVNDGLIALGETSSVNAGITNTGTLINNADGVIAVYQALVTPLYHEQGIFENSGLIKLLSVAVSPTIPSFISYAEFNNNPDAILIIENCIGKAIRNVGNGNFNNASTIRINSNASTASVAVENTGIFSNNGCGSLLEIKSDHTLQTTGSGVFNNSGGIIENSSGSSNISTNEGMIQDLGGGTFSVAFNNGTTTTEEGVHWRGCAGSDWTDTRNWLAQRVPGTTDDVIVRPAVNDPALSPSDTARIQSLRIHIGGQLTLKSSAKLFIESSP